MSATTNMTVGTIAVVGVGKIVKGDGFDVKTFMGGAIMALFLSALENIDQQLAQLFAGGILLTALYIYAIPITEKLGFKK